MVDVFLSVGFFLHHLFWFVNLDKGHKHIVIKGSERESRIVLYKCLFHKKRLQSNAQIPNVMLLYHNNHSDLLKCLLIDKKEDFLLECGGNMLHIWTCHEELIKKDAKPLKLRYLWWDAAW